MLVGCENLFNSARFVNFTQIYQKLESGQAKGLTEKGQGTDDLSSSIKSSAQSIKK